jgi:acetylornithine deacetylase/succinyl-diaminopimelate desuccinylase-like protein
VREHLSKRGFEDVKVKELLNEPVSRTPIEDPMLQKAIDIISDSYEEEVQLAITSGGSGPGHYVASRFNIPIFHLGAGYPETQAHAPNENVRVKDYLKALDATIDIILNID